MRRIGWLREGAMRRTRWVMRRVIRRIVWLKEGAMRRTR
jgi:hypothetical protein